jgi:hypothetical protein
VIANVTPSNLQTGYLVLQYMPWQRFDFQRRQLLSSCQMEHLLHSFS